MVVFEKVNPGVKNRRVGNTRVRSQWRVALTIESEGKISLVALGKDDVQLMRL